MNEKHTAGPWAAQREKLERAWDSNLNLRDVLQTVAEERDNLRAQNADLLAALQDLDSHACHAENLIAGLAIEGASAYFDEMRESQERARAAIARATGDKHG